MFQTEVVTRLSGWAPPRAAAKKNPNEGSHDAGAGGRKQNPQHDFLANARSSCASAAEGGGEKKFQTEVVKMLVLVAVLN